MRTSPRRIVCVSEGEGDSRALPELVNRWLRRRSLQRTCTADSHAVLVVVDADDACEDRRRAGRASLGPELRLRAEGASPHVPVGVVVANREFEAWLLADVPALRHRGVFAAGARLDEALWRDPESRRDCKTPLRQLLGRPYVEAIDQLALVKQVSLGPRMTRRSPSFRKLLSELSRLTREMRHAGGRTCGIVEP